MSSCLMDPVFIFSIAIPGAAAFLTYFITCGTIIIRRRLFKGTFFQLYVTLSIVAVTVYLARFPIIRFPLFTGKKCLLGPLFASGHFYGLEVFHFLHWHVGDVQYIMTMVVALDRFIVLLLGHKLNQLWNSYYWILILISFLIPLFSSQGIIFGRSSYVYDGESDCFRVVFTAPRPLLYNAMIGIQIVTVVIGVILNSIVIIHFLRQQKMMSKQRRTEVKLFLNSLAEVLTSIIMATILLLQVTTDVSSPFYVILRTLAVYASDLQQLIPPFVLVLTSVTLRRAIVDILKGRKSHHVTNISTSSRR